MGRERSYWKRRELLEEKRVIEREVDNVKRKM